MSLSFQISGFALVGLVATAFQYGLMAIFINALGMGTLPSSTLSYALSALLNYGLNRYFVFCSQVRHFDALPRFAVVVLFGLLINSVLMYIALWLLKTHWLILQMVVTLLVMGSNFLFSKYWIFHTGSLPVER